MRKAKVIFIALITTFTILGIYFASRLQSQMPPEFAVLIAFVLIGLVMLGTWVLASNY